jgi:anthranilate phosphoribosyltransferase
VKAPPAEVIHRKRDGAALGEDELAGFVAGIVDGRVSDAQIAAFAMARAPRGGPHARTRADAGAGAAALRRAILVGEAGAAPGSPVLRRIRSSPEARRD